MDTERERLIFASAGKLFSWQPGNPAVKQLADFNAHRFEELTPPYPATHW